MEIKKIWINREPNEHNVIYVNSNGIYRVQCNVDEIDEVEKEMSSGKLRKNFFGQPFKYLKEITFADNDDRLRLIGKHLKDDVHVSNKALRKEIFDYLKNESNPRRSYKKPPTYIEAISKPLIAILIIVAILTIELILIYKVNNGMVLEITNKGVTWGPSIISAITFGLASLGLTTNLLIFIPLLLIVVWVARKKGQNIVPVHYLKYN